MNEWSERLKELAARRIERRMAVIAALVWIVLGAAIAQAAPYALRGVIFGPSGKPWSHTDRLSVLPWMGSHGMNIYIHAPKEDLSQRLQWRDPYPADLLADFLEETDLAAADGVAWVPNLSPGFPLVPYPPGLPSRDVCFSCKGEIEVVLEKFAPFYGRGTRKFMVSFDDVQKISSNPEDLLTFGIGDDAYGVMTATFLNHVRDALDDLDRTKSDEVTLLTVPADYSGTAQTAYLAGFSRNIDPRIKVMWTGTAVVSHEIHAEDAAAFREAVWPAARFALNPAARPKLLVWDNFPVNDYAGNWFSGTGLPTNLKLMVGPYKGRRADLTDHIEGFLANPCNEAEAAKIPLYTVAAYLNAPELYTPDPAACNDPGDDVAGCRSEAAWLDGVAELAGPDHAEPLLDFLNQIRSTPLDRTEAPVFEARWKALAGEFASAFWLAPWRALVEELAREATAPGALRADFANRKFLEETRSHLDQLEENARVGALGAELLAAERPRLEVRSLERTPSGTVRVVGSTAPADLLRAATLLADLAPLEVLMRTSPYSVHGDRLQHDIANVYVGENRMDDFTHFVHAQTLTWLPLAPLAALGPLAVTVDGQPATLGADGSFSAEITPPAGATEITVVVVDAASFATGERLALP